MSLTRPLRLNSALKPDAYRAVFRTHRRLHVPAILDPGSARNLFDTVSGAGDWTRSIHLEAGKDVDIRVNELEALAADEREAFETSMMKSGKDSLAYIFDTVRISSELDGGRPVSAAMRAVHDFVNGRSFLDFFRRLTGDDRIGFADVMATRYLSGHFATAHGDQLPDQHRLYAYVLNLTPEWRADWGGILMFHDDDGHIAEGYVPRFNALNIFAVPQTHSVSVVSQLAKAPRLSITGWIHGTPATRVPAKA